jgi:hypothetical protein
VHNNWLCFGAGAWGVVGEVAALNTNAGTVLARGRSGARRQRDEPEQAPGLGAGSREIVDRPASGGADRRPAARRAPRCPP